MSGCFSNTSTSPITHSRIHGGREERLTSCTLKRGDTGAGAGAGAGAGRREKASDACSDIAISDSSICPAGPLQRDRMRPLKNSVSDAMGVEEEETSPGLFHAGDCLELRRDPIRSIKTFA
eukprot:753428-Hanusia_phi.AAC.2